MNTENQNEGNGGETISDLVCTLPNGMSVHHKNKHETDFLYKEIFLERAYLKNGVVLPAGACVFDVGANIGMFALFVKHVCADATIVAFEPIPDLFRILSLNLAPFGHSARACQQGVAGREGEATLTYYPGYTIMSGFHADEGHDAGILSSSMRQQLANNPAKRRPATPEHLLNMAKYALKQKTEIQCPMTTISAAIRDGRIEKIDLLKIDAEKSELEIMSGIQAEDWPKISQVVLEAHTPADAESMRTMLVHKGFNVVLEQADQLADSGVFNCFATRD